MPKIGLSFARECRCCFFQAEEKRFKASDTMMSMLFLNKNTSLLEYLAVPYAISHVEKAEERASDVGL